MQPTFHDDEPVVDNREFEERHSRHEQIVKVIKVVVVLVERVVVGAVVLLHCAVYATVLEIVVQEYLCADDGEVVDYGDDHASGEDTRRVSNTSR